MHPLPVRAWAFDLAAGVVVAAAGMLEAFLLAHAGYDRSIFPWIIALGIGAASALVRRAGWPALAILWLVFAIQVFTLSDVMITELAIVWVAFGLARWGSKPLLWTSGLSIPVVTFIALAYIQMLAIGIWGTRITRNLIVPLYDSGIPWQLVVLPLIAAALAIPWLTGLTLRYSGAARASQLSQSAAEAEAMRAHRETAQMQEIAALREEQARLARDVHDVVGHSLTVILAQAESAQFRSDSDTGALKRTMTNIAESARASLKEVRAVLAAPGGATMRSDLDELIDATRASGHHISVADTGIARPLPPELAAVAFRVLQEMLTNAIKHGERGGAIAVERDWGEMLTITVRNSVRRQQDAAAMPAGSGIEGMRRRLASVGGAFDIRLDPASTTVVASAWLPVRATWTVTQ